MTRSQTQSSRALWLVLVFLVTLPTQLWGFSSFPSTRHAFQPRRQYYPLYSSSLPLHDATLSEKTFSELYSDSMPDWLLEKCDANGWIHPTLIQQRALDCMFHDEPNSMVVQAQTGSGKTLTYLLPLLSQLEERAAVQAMIIVPTRELGLQVATIAKRLSGRKFMIMSLLQGSTLKRQRAWAWAETPHVVIGTPTEVLEMVKYGGLPRINSVRTVVVDEVDACLVHKSGAAMSNINDKTISSSLNQLLSKFLSPTYYNDKDYEEDNANTIIRLDNSQQNQKSSKRKFRNHRQTMFCSATIPQHRHFLKQCQANQWTLEEPVFVCTSPGEALPPTLEHAYLVCQSLDKKLATLRRKILPKLQTQTSSNNKILVFCEPSLRPMEEMAMAIARDLGGVVYQENKKKEDNVSDNESPVVSVLRYEDSLSQRAGATNAFRSTKGMRVLLTGDLAARGLDIAGISHVIHFDLPPDADTYVHRSGRAGRLGQSGQVITILTPDQEFVLQRLSNALNLGTKLKCIGRQKAPKTKKEEILE